jgi:acetylornithine deacetylase/succinyl-diaminopimelate desuccinylase-like protein/WD40 repeat protein
VSDLHSWSSEQVAVSDRSNGTPTKALMTIAAQDVQLSSPTPRTPGGTRHVAHNELWGKTFMDQRHERLPSSLAAQSLPPREAGSDLLEPLHSFGVSSGSPLLDICIRGKHVFAAEGGEEGCIGVWDMRRWEFLNRSRKQNGSILALTLAERDEFLIASVSNNSVVVWDISNPEEGLVSVARLWCPPIGHLLCLHMSSDGLLILGSQDASVRCASFPIRDFLATRDAFGSCREPRVSILSCASDLGDWDSDACGSPRAPEASLLKVPPESGVQLDLEERESSSEQKKCPAGQVYSIRQCNVQLRKGRKASGRGRGKCALDFSRSATHCGFVFAVARCGDYLCSGGGDGIVKVWHTETLNLAFQLVGHRGSVLALVADDRNTAFSGGTDGTVRVWDLELAACRRTLAGRSDVLALALSPAAIAIGYAVGEVHIVDLSSYRVLQRLRASPHPVLCIDIDPDDGLIVCGSSKGEFAAWRLPVLRCKRKPISLASPAFSSSFTNSPVNSLQAKASTGLNGSSLSDDKIEANAGNNIDHSKLRQASTAAREGLGVLPSKLVQVLGTDVEGGGLNVESSESLNAAQHAPGEFDFPADEGFMLNLLQDYISIPSISASAALHEECWNAARFTAGLMESLGCQVKLTTSPAHPCGLPVVLARFSSNSNASGIVPISSDPSAAGGAKGAGQCVVIYGHYDVAYAEKSNWDSDPFHMAGRDGYLYGRGASDNKGPIIAAALAARAVQLRGELKTDVVFILEGEEESGLSLRQRGFPAVVEANMHWFEGCRGILICNNYWIDDEKPCLTYGMRGVIDAEVWVSGGSKDLHSGVDGGAIDEPMNDVVALLASLRGEKGDVLVPGLTAGVREDDAGEESRREQVHFAVDRYRDAIGVARVVSDRSSEVLRVRWSKPCISVSSIESTNKARVFRKIPNAVVGRLSLHYVPDQDGQELEEVLKAHLAAVFAARGSSNRLRVLVKQTSTWWMGDLKEPIFCLARRALRQVWGEEPQLVREGGSYGGVTSFLEDTLRAPAVHLPLGQASDAAHLPNERIRVHNLVGCPPVAPCTVNAQVSQRPCSFTATTNVC